MSPSIGAGALTGMRAATARSLAGAATAAAAMVTRAVKTIVSFMLVVGLVECCLLVFMVVNLGLSV